MTDQARTRDQEEQVHETVREGYAAIAKSGIWLGQQVQDEPAAPAGDTSCRTGGSCCGLTTLDAETLAEQIGYSAEEIAHLPEGANMGLSCGNPTAIAELKPGEVVIDLGSGGGFDIFLAGPKVGSSGRAIGVDMTPDMISRARRSIDAYRERTGLDNIEFRLGEIEYLPVADSTVDVIISNCVINLSPDKPQVWREMARVLKPGGRVAVSDVALTRPLPEPVVQMVETWIGCVAGAVLVDETLSMAKDAGLTAVVTEEKPDYVEAMTDFNDPLYAKIAGALPEGTKPADFITSLNVQARKA